MNDTWIYGIVSALIATVIAFVVGWIVRRVNRWFKALTDKIEEGYGRMLNIHIALSDGEGNPVLHHKFVDQMLRRTEKIFDLLKEHNQSTQQHYVDVAKLAGDEKHKDCDVAKCLHISLIIKSLESVVARINQFEEIAKESRGNTQVSLDSLRSQMTDLTRDILATLRVFKGGAE